MQYNDRRFSTALRPTMGLGLFASIFVFMLIVTSLLSQLIVTKWGFSTTPLRVQVIIQDLFMFILPAIVTALLVSRLPAEFLEIMKGPRTTITLLFIVAMLAAIPLMNLVIAWNESWQLPTAFDWMREAEENAQNSVVTLMGGTDVSNLIVSVLIMGVLTGVAEEIFFRGSLQKLLMCTRMNPHAAIWIAALIFSAFHFQIFGFVPRVLLGALFGYAMWWSGSLWLPILLHAINNSIVVINQWMIRREFTSLDFDTIGASGSLVWLWVTISVVITAGALTLAYRNRIR